MGLEFGVWSYKFGVMGFGYLPHNLYLITYNLAYIDPGSGSYLYQFLLAFGLGIVYFFRSIKLYLYKIWSLFSKKKEND